MPIDLTCGACGRDLYLKDELAGRQIRCPECQAVLTVPAPGVPPPLEPAAEALPDLPPPPAPDPYRDRAEEPAPAVAPPPREVMRPLRRSSTRESSGGRASVGGGIMMMILAVIIFGGGMAMNILLLRWPIILFVGGLISVVRGLMNKSE